MKSNPQLLNALASLTDGLDDPLIDLHERVSELVVALAHSIDSLVSVALTVVVDHRPYSVTVPVGSGSLAVSSVSIPLGAPSEPATGSRLVLWAGAPGAFDELIADVSSAMDCDPTTFDTVTHLPARTAFGGSHAVDMHQDLEDRSAIDQALGVLLERGLTMREAGRHLTQRAELDDVSLADAARAVIDDAVNVHRPDF